MPRIMLRDKDSGEVKGFEPVDAREILRNPDKRYEATEQQLGSLPLTKDGKPITMPAAGGLPRFVTMDEDGNPLMIPQTHGGADDEMQINLSVDSYRRADVVKAGLGPIDLPAFPAMPGAEGLPEGAGQRAGPGQSQVGDTGKSASQVVNEAEAKDTKEGSAKSGREPPKVSQGAEGGSSKPPPPTPKDR